MKVLQQKLAPPRSLSDLRRGGVRLRQRLPSGTSALAGVALVFLALLLGMVVALGSIELTIILAGVLVIVPIVFLVNLNNMLPLLFALVFLIQGPAQSFFHLRLAAWMASVFGALFFAKALLELVHSRRRPSRADPVSSGGGVILAASLYLVFFAFSLTLGHASTAQVISTVRFCVPMFGVLFALYWFEWPEQRIRGLWMMLVGIAVVQVPLVFYQHFFSIGSDGWDAVVGSFGVGMSPILVIFSLTGLLYFLARWARGLTPGWAVSVVFTATMAVVLLGEVKAVVLWIPLGVFLIMRRRILRNPMAFVTFGIFLVLFVGGTFAAYKAMYWGEVGGGGNTVQEKFDRTSGYVFDPNGVNYVTGEVSRGASLALWYRDPVPTALERLIGYGPGASSTSQGAGRGVVAARYRTLQLNATALAQLLWDVGILGTLVYLGIFASAIAVAWRYVARGTASPERLAIVDTAMVALILLLTTVIYNRALLDEPTVQLFFFFCLGSIVQFCRFGPQQQVTPAVNDAPAAGYVRGYARR